MGERLIIEMTLKNANCLSPSDRTALAPNGADDPALARLDIPLKAD